MKTENNGYNMLLKRIFTSTVTVELSHKEKMVKRHKNRKVRLVCREYVTPNMICNKPADRTYIHDYTKVFCSDECFAKFLKDKKRHDDHMKDYGFFDSFLDCEKLLRIEKDDSRYNKNCDIFSNISSKLIKIRHTYKIRSLQGILKLSDDDILSVKGCGGSFLKKFRYLVKEYKLLNPVKGIPSVCDSGAGLC